MTSPTGKAEQARDSDERKSMASACDRLLDLGVYAPIGLLLGGDDIVRGLAAEGRKQVAFSRSLGRAALRAVARGAQGAPDAPKKPSKQGKVVGPDPSTEPSEVQGYDDLTAREVIALVGTCNDDTAAWIRKAETAGKKRVTVLRALDAR